MGISDLRRKLDAARNTFDYRLEKVLFHVAEQVCKLIDSQEISRSELAQRLAVTPAYITKLLNGNPNLTIKTLLRISDALDQTLDIHFVSKIEIAQSRGTAVPPAPRVQMQAFSNFVAPSELKVERSEADNDLALAA